MGQKQKVEQINLIVIKMKRYLVHLAVLCGTCGAFATNYNAQTDYVVGTQNNNGWSYGYMIGDYDANQNIIGIDTATPWVADTYGGTVNGTDSWYDPTSANGTCHIFYGGLWSFPAGSLVENSWVAHAAAVQLQAAPGTYNLSATWMGGGFITPTTNLPNTEVYVLLNGGTASQSVLYSDHLLGFTSTSTSQQITISAGDTLDFVEANGNAATPNSRASLEATLTLVPEPAAMAVLGLASLSGLLFLRRRR